MNKVLISTSTFDLAAQQQHTDFLRRMQYEMMLNPYHRRCTAPEIITLLQDGVVGLIAGLEPLTREVLEKAHDLKVISRCGVGLDNVDLEAADALGIKVYNTPEAPSVAVAELTIGLMLSLLRHISLSDRMMRSNAWKPMMGRLLSRQTVGIIGYGRIGKKVIRLLEAFGCDILIHDPLIKQQGGHRFVDIDELLRYADVVSLHLPYSLKNHHFLNETKLALMPKTSVLINTARGGLVDEDALYQKISTGALAGAALDVFEDEPYKGKLLELSNVLLTSHMGSYAKESRISMEEEAMKNLILGLQMNHQSMERSTV